MRLRGIVRTAELAEYPPGGDRIEMVLRVQGVAAGLPRKIIVPFDLLLQDDSLEPEAVQGHAFEAEVEEVEEGRWVTTRVSFAGGRALREPDVDA